MSRRTRTLLSTALATLVAVSLATSASAAPPDKLKQFKVPTVGSSPDHIIRASDGNFWFTESFIGNPNLVANNVGRITPAGVMRPTLFATRFGLPMNDSVNQKLPSLARMMWSGLLPTVGTLNCFSLSGGAADADVARLTATRVARAVDSNVRVRRDMVCSRIESPSTRGIVEIGSPPLLSLSGA